MNLIMGARAEIKELRAEVITAVAMAWEQSQYREQAQTALWQLENEMAEMKATIKEARSVWMNENPCEVGHDPVTPFDRFLYGTNVQQSSEI